MLLTLIGAALLLLAAVIVRRIWFHPLSSYPGPFLAKFTDLLSYYDIYKASRSFGHHALLQRYGSPVRIGPNTLLYSDPQSWTDIYASSSEPCLKDPALYSGFSLLGKDNVLSATERSSHGSLRRLLAHSFSLRGLAEAEPFVNEKIQQFVDVTFKSKPGKPVDVLSKTYELYLDIVSWLSFGQSFNCLGGQNTSARRNVENYFNFVPLFAFLPFLRYAPIKAIREGLAGINSLIDFSATHVDAYLEKDMADSPDSRPDGSLLANMTRAVDEENGSKLTRNDLVEHGILFLTAGSSTTASTLIFLLWECGRDDAVRQRLAEEIRAAFPSTEQLPTYQKAAQLTFLRCVILETLRLWGPLNSSAPRLSPGKSICGRYVPRGTVVETNAYSAARDPAAFPDPLAFKPSRWESPTPEMKQQSRPFSHGPHNCIGQNLANMALTLTVARLYQLYDVVPNPSTVLEQEDKGVLEPKADVFYVTAVERSEKVEGAMANDQM